MPLPLLCCPRGFLRPALKNRVNDEFICPAFIRFQWRISKNLNAKMTVYSCCCFSSFKTHFEASWIDFSLRLFFLLLCCLRIGLYTCGTSRGVYQSLFFLDVLRLFWYCWNSPVACFVILLAYLHFLLHPCNSESWTQNLLWGFNILLFSYIWSLVSIFYCVMKLILWVQCLYSCF